MTPTINGKPPGVASAEGAEENTFCVARFSPREARALQALAGAGDWIAREALDRIAGASNSPDIIMRLRRKLGRDAIDRRHIDALDRDNRPCRPGQYRLTEQGRQRLAQMRTEVAP